MFIGHYGISLGAKAYKKSIPLGVLFIAVQFVDVVWAVFVLLGIEKVRIVPGFTATNPLDLYYMPYTHSLAGSLAWALAACLVYAIVSKQPDKWVAGLIVGGAVFSHWLLDLLVHRPDLPLYDSVFKMGFGLWNYPVVAFALEVALLFGGMGLYLRSTLAKGPAGRFGMIFLGLVMIATQAYVFFGPPPTSDRAIAATALIFYVLFAGAAQWLDRVRA